MKTLKEYLNEIQLKDIFDEDWIFTETDLTKLQSTIAEWINQYYKTENYTKNSLRHT